VTVSDDQVAAAARVIEDAGYGPVEPSGAAALAAVLADRAGGGAGRVACIVSGGNA